MVWATSDISFHRAANLELRVVIKLGKRRKKIIKRTSIVFNYVNYVSQPNCILSKPRYYKSYLVWDWIVSVIRWVYEGKRVLFSLPTLVALTIAKFIKERVQKDLRDYWELSELLGSSGSLGNADGPSRHTQSSKITPHCGVYFWVPETDSGSTNLAEVVRGGVALDAINWTAIPLWYGSGFPCSIHGVMSRKALLRWRGGAGLDMAVLTTHNSDLNTNNSGQIKNNQ